MKIIENQKKIYQTSFDTHGPTPMGTIQNDTTTQFLRFAKLMEHLEPLKKNFTIHDVGSGISDLHKYLLNKTIDHIYSGSELIEDMVNWSKKQYPEIEIYNRNYLEASKKEKYDFVVLSGTLNYLDNTTNNEWTQYVKSIITKMFQMSTVGIAFNLLSSHNTFSKKELYYANPSEFSEFCNKTFSRFVVVDQSYPLYEFTITVLHKDAVKTMYGELAYSKYFVK